MSNAASGLAHLKPFLPGLEPLLENAEVSEIMINGPGNVWIEAKGRLTAHAAPGLDESALLRAAIHIARPLGLDPATAPIIDARLDDGSRVAICVPPASPHVAITIRRFGKRTFSAADLVGQKALPENVLKAAEQVLMARRNILVSGGTGSGKTTLLNALIELLPVDERIVAIEDTLELRIDRSNCVRFEARGLQEGAVTIRDLVRHALRHRPDHIVVGEVRGGEAADLLQALNTGHGGSLTTVHANNAESALSRIASCAMQGGGELPWEVTCRGVVDVTGDLEIQEDGSLSIQTEMEPLGELTISTHGQGELVSGSVKVVSYGPIGGLLRFDLPGIGVAGVGVSPPVRDAVFPVRRQEAGINTGVAIHNLESSPELVRCELMREGVLHDAASIPLAANGQVSWFIDEVFTGADTSDFAGSVHCDAAGPGMFTAVALELDAASRIFTTLPVFPTRRAGGRSAELNFAHFANGAGLASDLVFVNLSTERSRPAPTPFHSDILPVRPAIYFYDTEGALVSAESVVDLTGDLEVMEDGGLTVQTEMEPLGVLTISTHGRGELVSGSVRVIADEPIGGGLRFDLPEIGVAGVGVSSPVHDALFPVRRQEAGINTGVAVHNLGEEAMEVTCELMQGGTVLDDVSIPLAANGQSSWFINEVFTGADTSDFVGSVRCTAPEGGLFTGVAVELDAANRIFTTLPVVPVPERMSRE